MQKPTLSSTEIAFVYAGDLWIVSCQGGEARRLTNGTGIETDPVFSPDGSVIAFSGEYDGNVDVFIIRNTPTPHHAPRSRQSRGLDAGWKEDPHSLES